MSEYEDPRASRSRRALLDAVASLLEQREVADISVTELVVAAGVSRPTFYQHFSDVAAVAAAAAIEVLEELFRTSDAATVGVSAETFIETTSRTLIAELYSRRTFYQRVLSGASSYEAVSKVIGLLEARMHENAVGSLLVSEGRAEQEVADRVAVAAAGTAWLVIQWLGSDFRGANSRDAMAARLAATTRELSGIGVSR